MRTSRWRRSVQTGRKLSVSARYRTPMGAVGRMLDRALLHRVAEATVKDFLDRVGERLRSRGLARS